MKKLSLIILSLCVLAVNAFAFDFVTIPNTFVAKQLIRASQVMANYNALKNGVSDGSKKVDVAELYINSNLTIGNNQNVSANIISVDNLTFDTNTISSITSNILLAPVSGSAVIVDSHWSFDGTAMTALTDADTAINAYAGKAVVIDSHWDFDGPIMTALTDADTAINAYAGKAVVVDSHWDFDGPIMTALTDADTQLNAYAGKAVVIDSHWDFDGPIMTALTDADTELVAYAGKAVELDGHWSFDNGTMTAQVDQNTTINAYAGKNVNIESVTIDGGAVGGVTTLGVSTINATGKITNTYNENTFGIYQIFTYSEATIAGSGGTFVKDFNIGDEIPCTVLITWTGYINTVNQITSRMIHGNFLEDGTTHYGTIGAVQNIGSGSGDYTVGGANSGSANIVRITLTNTSASAINANSFSYRFITTHTVTEE
jgi:hypothetical protein